MTKAIFAGSFDPLTRGHEGIILVASKIFQEVWVVISDNSQKKSLFNLNQKQEIIKYFINESNISNVKVKVLPEGQYLAKYAKDNDIEFLIRGVRNTQDFEYEKTIETVNQEINPLIKTIYLSPGKDLVHLSSSLVKSLVGYGQWREVVEKMVNPKALTLFRKKEAEKLLSSYWKKVDSTAKGQEYFENVILEKYSELHRYYHDYSHLVELFKKLEELRDVSSLKEIIKNQEKELIYQTFFHDLVYDPKKTDNEEVSAKMFEDYYKQDDTTKSKVVAGILATKSHTKPTQYEINDVFLDLDLSILSAAPEKFKEYEDNIRREYSFVPEDVYIAARGNIMKNLNISYKNQDLEALWGSRRELNLAIYKK